jgi:hypothetical protein
MILKKRGVGIIFFFNCFLLVGIILSPWLRKRIVIMFPAITYIFANEMRNRYTQQRYIFTYLKLKGINFSKIKAINGIFFLNGVIYLDNPTEYDSLAPILQYKIVLNPPKNQSHGEPIILEQSYYKMNSIIPAKSINHRINIEISQKINSKLWRSISKKKENITILYKLIERYN